MVEDEDLAESAPEPRDRPIDFRRVADVEDVEAAPEQRDPQRKHERRQEAPQRLGDKAKLALAFDRPPVAVDVDPLALLARLFEPAPLGTDEADRVAVRGKRRPMQPSAPVERHRQTLEDIKDASSRCSGGHWRGAYLAKRR